MQAKLMITPWRIFLHSTPPNAKRNEHKKKKKMGMIGILNLPMIIDWFGENIIKMRIRKMNERTPNKSNP